MGDEKFLVTLEVDGRRYPLRIKRSEEEAFRKAAKEIDKKIIQYRVKFGANPNLTAQDFMAMTAIQALAGSLSIESKNNTKPYEDKIGSLINELDIYLKKVK